MTRASRTFKNTSQVQQAAAERAIHELLLSDESLCEPLVLSRIQGILEAEKLPSRAQDTVDFLILLRMTDRLDDVILYPLWKASQAWINLGFPLEIQPGGPSIPASDSVSLKDRTSSFFRNLPARCPTHAWKAYLDRKRAVEKKSYTRKSIPADLQEAATRRLIPAHLQAWFMDLHLSRADDLPYLLENIITNYKLSKNARIDTLAVGSSRNSLPGAAREKSAYYTELVKGQSFTRRMSLYARYNYDQIFQLSDLLVLHAKIAFAPQAAIVYRDAEGKEIYSHPLEGQDVFDSSVLVLRELIEKTGNRKAFENVPIQFEDLVLAAIETGAIDGKYTREALKVDDMWNPQVTTKEKLKKWARRVVGPAVILIPPPFNMVASVAMVLSEQFLLKQKEHSLPVFPGSKR